jgi:hypothetical protein
MNWAPIALAAGLASTPLLATPVHAAPSPTDTPTYVCKEALPTYEVWPRHAHGRECKASPGAQTSGFYKLRWYPEGGIRVILPDGPYDWTGRFWCARIDLDDYPKAIYATQCQRDRTEPVEYGPQG